MTNGRRRPVRIGGKALGDFFENNLGLTMKITDMMPNRSVIRLGSVSKAMHRAITAADTPSFNVRIRRIISQLSGTATVRETYDSLRQQGPSKDKEVRALFRDIVDLRARWSIECMDMNRVQLEQLIR